MSCSLFDLREFGFSHVCYLHMTGWYILIYTIFDDKTGKVLRLQGEWSVELKGWQLDPRETSIAAIDDFMCVELVDLEI